MKFFYRKFLTVFLILLFAFYAKAVNDTLTIRQAFDLKVGDTLVYTGWENGQFFGNQNVYQQPWGMTIINRLEFSDTIDFTYQILGVGFVAHLILTHLDSTTDVHADFGSYNRNSFFWISRGVLLKYFRFYYARL
ncbi:MAG: hypothetical protein NTY88_06280 [Bacteroidetes bacterium]|nr:hypothetical protein [Bacteroidota bacterium]